MAKNKIAFSKETWYYCVTINCEGPKPSVPLKISLSGLLVFVLDKEKNIAFFSHTTFLISFSLYILKNKCIKPPPTEPMQLSNLERPKATSLEGLPALGEMPTY